MGKPSPPPAPNYQQSATQQGAANVEAAQKTAILNNPNIISPYGRQTVTYSSSPIVDQQAYDQAMQNWRNTQGQTDENGNPISSAAPPDISQFTRAGDLQPTVTQTLTPESQAALEAQQRITQKLSGLGESAIGTAQKIMGTPFQYTGPGIETSAGPELPLNYGPAMGMYGMAGSVAPDQYGMAQGINAADYGQAQGINAGAYGQAQGVNASPYGNLQSRLDLSGVAAMPVNAGTTAQQAIMNRLQPQIAQQSAALTQQLANQGITPGSEAWNNAMREQQQQQNDLVSQAALQGIGLDIAANQQGYGQALGAANLYNQALGQGFGQAAQAQQMANQAIAQNYGQGIGAQQLANQAIAQNFGQGLQGNQAINAAIAQNYGQGMGSQQLANQAMAQNYGQAATSAGLYNQAAAQAFNQNLAARQFANQAALQAYQQQLAQYNQPLNQIAALLGGAQIQTPQFQQYTGGGQIGAAPIFQAATNQGNYNTAAYNAQMQALGGLYSGLGSMAGAGLGAWIGSDVRIKSNIVKVGEHPKGFGIYEYDKFGRRERGVLAQEVEKIMPEAVMEHPDGYKMVNYGAL